MSRLTPDQLRFGDVVQLRRTLHVDGFPGEGFVHASDVQSGEQFLLTDEEFDNSTSRLSMVKRALRNVPKPAVGSVIDGKTLRNTMWKRGTVMLTKADESGPVTHTLQADGVWRAVNTDGRDWRWSFDPMNDEVEFTVLHVA